MPNISTNELKPKINSRALLGATARYSYGQHVAYGDHVKYGGEPLTYDSFGKPNIASGPLAPKVASKGE